MPVPKLSQSQDTLYFITCSIVEKIDVFLYKDFFDIITDALKYCQNNKSLKLYGYVIMPNHLHLIVSSDKNLAGILRDFKHYTANQIVKKLKEYNRDYILNIFSNAGKQRLQKHQVWNNSNYPEAIETEKFFFQKLEYIHNNPIKRGFVEKAEDWIYSSARNYILGDEMTIKLKKI